MTNLNSRNLTKRRAPLLLTLLVVALVATMAAATSGTWTFTGSMSTAREFHTAILLPGGEVLVAGGNLFATAELYHPATGTWTVTGSMNQARSGPVSTLLKDGQVLVVGGSGNGNELTSAELYNPATGTWTLTGSMSVPSGSPATLLQNGDVLVAGGLNTNVIPSQPISSVEIYNPSTGLWTKTASLSGPRQGLTQTLLANGEVLVAGGSSTNNTTGALASAVLFHPSTATWTSTGSMHTARSIHFATLLPSGEVLVAGGLDANGNFLNSAELYNPATGKWTVTGSLNLARDSDNSGLTLLADGKVLVEGGFFGTGRHNQRRIV